MLARSGHRVAFFASSWLVARDGTLARRSLAGGGPTEGSRTPGKETSYSLTLHPLERLRHRCRSTVETIVVLAGKGPVLNIASSFARSFCTVEQVLVAVLVRWSHSTHPVAKCEGGLWAGIRNYLMPVRTLKLPFNIGGCNVGSPGVRPARSHRYALH